MTIIFNEKQYAEQLLSHGFKKFMSLYDLSVLAKYLKYIGKNKKQIENDLILFCEKFNPFFNKIIYADKIRIALNSMKKYDIKLLVDISISQKEINTIVGVDNYKYEKILFVMLVYAKYKKQLSKKSDVGEYYVNSKFSQILKIAKVNVCKKEQDTILHSLFLMGMVESTFYGTYKINYVDRDGEPVISVLVDDNMVNVYKNIRGDVLVICKICGKSFKQNSNRHSFCIECSKQRRNEKVKENMAKMRNKINVII